MPNIQVPFNLLLADDDEDDRLFFNEALQELPIDTLLKTVNDGHQLMDLLTSKSTTLPDILFLDLNMPLKSGYECLKEIKRDEKLKFLPVIIYSTSINPNDIKQLYEQNASCYVCKPAEYCKLKKVIHEALKFVVENDSSKPPIEKFVIKV